MRTWIICLIGLFGIVPLRAQTLKGAPDAAKVCLYVDTVKGMNPWLTRPQQDRLRAKLVLAASRSGTIHVGLSSFLLYPQVDIAEVNVSDVGMKPFTVAKLEMILSIARLDRIDAPLSKPGTIFGSEMITLIGTGSDTVSAVNNALGTISGSDPAIARLIQVARERIMAYYMEHCYDVTAEAARAYDLQNYAMSIALLYSVPEGTPCYDSARDLSVKAYHEYQKTICQRQLLQLKTSGIIQKGPDVDAGIKQRQYAEIIALVKGMDPTAEGCYEEAYNLLNGLSADFDANNKQRWEGTTKLITEQASVDREMYKAMAEVSAKQQPGPFNVILGR